MDKAEAARRLGRSNAELEALLSSGAAIGFDDKKRGYLIPAQQFVGNQILPGISDVCEVLDIPKQIWIWLVTGNGRFGGDTPISALNMGRVDEVAAQARYDFADW